MANEKEIRDKIKSIKGTQKITKAMEMVAASKMRRAQEKMAATRPFNDKIQEMIAHIANAQTAIHPLIEGRDTIKRVGYIVVGSDRGLCGGLNVNLFKKLAAHCETYHKTGVELDFACFGAKALDFLKRFNFNVVAMQTELADKVYLSDVLGIIKIMVSAFLSGNIDKLYIAYNKFGSTMLQIPVIEQILPVDRSLGKQSLSKFNWDYIYEPSVSVLLDVLLRRYIDSTIYQAVVENIACELAARMVSMKNATDNARDLIEDFQLQYNKARQAAITQEISEIVAGAAAV